jgi:hypothetical protein
MLCESLIAQDTLCWSDPSCLSLHTSKVSGLSLTVSTISNGAVKVNLIPVYDNAFVTFTIPHTAWIVAHFFSALCRLAESAYTDLRSEGHIQVRTNLAC